MNNTPLISILIPLYNAEQYIEETITRALEQTYSNIELIIVDDHSTDQSLSIAQKYACNNIHIYTNPKKGGNAARNYAFQMSKGEYVKFMDADDYCSKDMVEKQLKAILEKGTQKSLAFSPVEMLYPDGSLVVPHREIDKDYFPGIELLIDIWKGKGWNCPHCHLMHRSLVTLAKGWDETIIKNRDGEFFARIASLADKALSVKDTYAYWRQTGIGVSTKRSIESHASMLKSYDIISSLILHYKDSTDNRKICAKYISFFVYQYYPEIKPLLPEIDKLLLKLKQPLILPNRKILIILKFILGWKRALTIIKKFNL